MSKLRTAGSFLIFLSILMFLFNINNNLNYYYLHYFSLVVGVILLAFTSIKNRDEDSMLCRVGLHKFELVDWDSEIKSRSIYKCERCGKEKKVMRGV
ncbi:MAG: hypothetical protein WBV93_00545 [Anaerobacillus sp.]